MATFRSRSIDDLLGSGGIDFQVQYQAISWTILGSISALLLLLGKVDFSLVRRGPLAWLLAFAALGVASSLYSLSPLITLYYSIQSIVLILLVCAIGKNVDKIYYIVCLYAALNWIVLIMGTAGFGLGLDWITTAEESYVRYGGSRGELWRFSTAFGHPSLIAIVAAMGAVGLAAQRSRWSGKRLIVGWLTLTVVLTLSRTAIAGMAAGFLVIAVLRHKISGTLATICLLAALVLSIPGLDERLVNVFMRGQSSQDFSSLTGRSEIYSAALQRLEQAWWGEGFRSLRGRPLIGEQWGHGVSHAHNLVLQASIDLGVAGVLAVVMCLFSLTRDAVRLAFPSRRLGLSAASDIEPIAVLFPILAFCALDSGFAMNVNVFVIAFVMFCASTRRKVAQQAPATRYDSTEFVTSQVTFNHTMGRRYQCLR
ncbi:O-antigen ligase family protein [Mesorhizobium sp. WSM2239]|uniref:O-antigen ligase family protein n=2 Tax=unclassified Mesorhizobium TaxID=325217 RepID=A0AAU8DH32_9HYPH